MQNRVTQIQQDTRAEALSNFLVVRRGIIAAFGVVVSLILFTGLLSISFDTSLGILLTENDPYLQEYERLEENFPSSLTISYAFVPENQKIFSQESLQALQQLTANYRQIPHAQSITSLLNFQSPTQSLALFRQAVENYSVTELAELERQAIGNQFLITTMLSPNADLTLATIRLDAGSATAAQRLEIADAATKLANEIRTENPQIRIHMNSEVLYEKSSKEAMLSDLITLLPLVILVSILVVCFCFRSVFYGLCILVVAALAVAITISTVSWLGIAFNTVSVMAPLVVVIISTADSVHIVSIFRQEMRPGAISSLSRNQSIEQAMKRSISLNLHPIGLASVTTAIGFLSLRLSSAPGINDFGLIVAIGVVYAFILTLVFLPALILFSSKLIPSRSLAENSLTEKTVRNKTISPQMEGLISRVIYLINNHERKLFWFFSAFGLSTFLMLPLNQTDFNRLDFIDADSDLGNYYDVVIEKMNRGTILEYGIDNNTVDGAIDPEFLNKLESFNSWLVSQPEIEDVASLIEISKTINQIKHGSREQYYVIPETLDAIAQDLNEYRAVERKGFELDRFIDNNYSMLKLFINTQLLSNQQLLNLDARISNQFDELMIPANGDQLAPTLLHGSSLLLFARMDKSVTLELLQGYSVSLLLITLTLIIGLGSVYYGILSILPNLLPATIVFGLWGLFVGQIDPFVMMLFSISIGLVVDDTVHLLEKYLRLKKQGKDNKTAIQDSIRIAGPALTITTMVLAIGTIIMIGASTLYFQQAARLLVPIVVLALVIDLLYLPTILIRFDKGKIKV